MRIQSLLLVAGLVAMALAGCLGDDAPDDRDGETARPDGAVPGTKALTADEAPVFADSFIIDDVRAGGEPVIAVLPSGTLLISAHPGWTHLHPKDPTTVATDLLAPANGQSYLWRSTDGGETWQHVNLQVEGTEVPVDNAPRSTALGVSDPEFTVMEDGTVCMTDLIALASSSTSCSMDDGQTWLPGNSAASGGVNDRQWLASSGDEFYFTAAYFASTTGAPDHHIRASTDYGMTWEDRGDVPCSQDLVGNPHTGNLVVACGPGVSVSEDGGFTWTPRGERAVNLTEYGFLGGSPRMAEPAIDAAGNTWVTWANDESRLYVAGSPDEGVTWPWAYEVTPHFRAWALDNPHGIDVEDADDGFGSGANGTYVWPWISAGSDGRFAVTWIGSYDDAPSSQQSGPWHVFTAYFLDATTAEPTVHVAPLTQAPMHLQPICQSGTTCQATSATGDPSGDRRLGDFFETTIDAEGFLHGTWSNTAAEPDDVVSHAEYVRQTDGIRLLIKEDIGVYMPTQG